eukprot:TRINITY_DN7821_c0_g1_i1.p1 TRINITY_DN7821_c0_g1~~TRINITY_DN7821_c0_g1_i1.p1  ORF type:complete len:427 (+),score=66.67 TRINITY_DN7821_c0_g1_i1:162-1283(+)
MESTDPSGFDNDSEESAQERFYVESTNSDLHNSESKESAITEHYRNKSREPTEFKQFVDNLSSPRNEHYTGSRESISPMSRSQEPESNVRYRSPPHRQSYKEEMIHRNQQYCQQFESSKREQEILNSKQYSEMGSCPDTFTNIQTDSWSRESQNLHKHEQNQCSKMLEQISSRSNEEHSLENCENKDPVCDNFQEENPQSLLNGNNNEDSNIPNSSKEYMNENSTQDDEQRTEDNRNDFGFEEDDRKPSVNDSDNESELNDEKPKVEKYDECSNEEETVSDIMNVEEPKFKVKEEVIEAELIECEPILGEMETDSEMIECKPTFGDFNEESEKMNISQASSTWKRRSESEARAGRTDHLIASFVKNHLHRKQF